MRKANYQMIKPEYMHGSNPIEPSHLSKFTYKITIIRNTEHKNMLKNDWQPPDTYPGRSRTELRFKMHGLLPSK